MDNNYKRLEKLYLRDGKCYGCEICIHNRIGCDDSPLSDNILSLRRYRQIKGLGDELLVLGAKDSITVEASKKTPIPANWVGKKVKIVLLEDE